MINHSSKKKKMTKNFFEALILASVAVNAALLIFLADIFRKMMNDTEEPAFKNIIVSMVRHSSKSLFMIFVLNVPLLVAIPYYCMVGFSNWWLTAGLTVWIIAGGIAKAYKLPVYKALAAIQDTARAEIGHQRTKFNRGNIFQAVLYFIAMIIIGIGIYH